MIENDKHPILFSYVLKEKKKILLKSGSALFFHNWSLQQKIYKFSQPIKQA